MLATSSTLATAQEGQLRPCFAKAASLGLLPPEVSVTFPPDHQGQLARVGLPAGFDEHHHLVMGVL